MSGQKRRQELLRPRSLIGLPFAYCSGCSHGILHRLVAQALDDLDLREQSIGVASVGCSVRMWKYFDCDMVQALHGRGPALATGLKRSLPDRVVWVYQGDGDMAAIGLAHVVHAAARGERFTIFYLNNGCYGATGGQMAPTTLLGQVTATTPSGRDAARFGYPIRMLELLATLDAPLYLARAAVTDPARIRETQRLIQRALQVQMAGSGFSLVEVLGVCPTNLHLEPPEAVAWTIDHVVPAYELGELRLP